MAGRRRRPPFSDAATVRLAAALLRSTLPLVALGCSSSERDLRRLDGTAGDGGSASGGSASGNGGTKAEAGNSTGPAGSPGTGEGGAANSGDSGAAGAPDVKPWSASIGTVCGPDGDHRLWLVANPDFVACRAQAELISAESTRDGFSLDFSEGDLGGDVLELEGRTCRDGVCETLPIALSIDEYTEGASARGTFRIETSSSRELIGHFDAAWCHWDDYLPADSRALVPARSLKLQEIAVFQAVKVSVMQARVAATERNAPIVAGRPALVRAYVTPGASWLPRRIRAKLTLVGVEGSGDPLVVEQTMQVVGGSSDEQLESTFNFTLPADAVREDARYSLELFEAEPCATVAGQSDGVRFPEEPESFAQLGATAGGPARIVIVPVKSAALLPDTSTEQIERLQRRLFRLFPVTAADVTVRAEPLVTDATSMVEALDHVAALRDEDNPGETVSYYGLVRFTDLLSEYCATPCVLGAAVTGETSGGVATRGGSAVGVGYSGEVAEETFAHEMGHVFGREHSPCNVAGDANFPYRSGGIGSWGYDLLDGSLLDPSIYKDFMGYCAPNWVSDYVYSSLAAFIAGMNRPSSVLEIERKAHWRTLLIEPGRSPRWGVYRTLAGRPAGIEETARLEDSVGRERGSVPVYRSIVSDAGAVLVYVPAGLAKQGRIRIRGIGPHPLDEASATRPQQKTSSRKK